MRIGVHPRRRLPWRSTFSISSSEPTAEAERVVAWLRLPAIALIALGEGLQHPNPHHAGFHVVLALFSAWSAAVLALVYLGPVGPRLALAATGVDIVAISVLALLSGGAYSDARLAFFLVPVAVAFRYRPEITAAAAFVTTAAYVVEAVAHPARRLPDAPRFILTTAGYLAWVGVACVILSMLLGRRTALAGRLAEERAQLLADALEAEQRERKGLAEALHEGAIQNLLSARHELDEAGEALSPHPALTRADDALTDTIGQLREAVFDLHPYVLEEAGLEAAIRTVAQRTASHARLCLKLELRYPKRHPQEQLVFSAARELLSNVVRHAEASEVAVRLVEEENGALVLVVSDDGRGFPPERLAERLANGHVGVASQRVRVESAGGTMTISSEPGTGTRTEIRLPADRDRSARASPSS
jgi:two-component system NarL family sensor kinase